jgi:hypothetical protein
MDTDGIGFINAPALPGTVIKYRMADCQNGSLVWIDWKNNKTSTGKGAK